MPLKRKSDLGRDSRAQRRARRRRLLNLQEELRSIKQEEQKEIFESLEALDQSEIRLLRLTQNSATQNGAENVEQTQQCQLNEASMTYNNSRSNRTWSLESMRQALQAVDGGMSVRSSAELYGIPRNTLTTYVASELRLEDEMKFMENFDPEKSKREQRKLNRKISNVATRKSVYDEKGIHVKTGLDLCDCLNDKCEGCFFPCTRCRSTKCGHECRSPMDV
ncbi:uncharacterized protein LOC128986157 isoform X2 [Macrosteles quadrilineatus]|uniref:uncharacterized protein LOC128986134 isoform X3 n=1 Tax=Macrosteles quadrilineatus TaxID=74068 RepID=UPI0023E226A8|nr:uncharacterized protein LOC128986134 isoform X3 [Macrosteles quadrilineatus]XP_054262305.1 uncharacterized protein LOC128986157 isoform X2 [Macrosteles quadrilineatus]